MTLPEGELMDNEFEERLEGAYWEYDALVKGYADRIKYTERDAFKMALRQFFNEMPPNNLKEKLNIFASLRDAIYSIGRSARDAP